MDSSVWNGKDLFTKNGDRLCIESGCHWITNRKIPDKSYLSMLMTQVYSIEKYFIPSSGSIQTREDNLYQEVLEYIRGINKNKENIVEGSIAYKLLQEESKYSRVINYKFGFMTWNLAGKSISKELDLEHVLSSDVDKYNQSPADIYFVAFQETRKLNAFAILQGANKAKGDKLNDMAKIALDNNAKKYDDNSQYLWFVEVSLWGLLLLGYCKTSIKWKISKIATTKVKQGLGGKAGNKGAVLVRFNLDNTSVVVANAHLESGQKKISDRLYQFKQIVNDSIIGKRRRRYDYKSHNLKFFMGDLNFRVDMDYEFAKIASINFQQDDMHILQKADQLLKLKSYEPEMEALLEGPLNFRPTYKYDNNSDLYDNSKKMRVPSWCDRILWFENEKQIEQLNYERKESLFSDHRPVQSYMNIIAYQHDSKLMMELKEQMIKEKKEEFFKGEKGFYFTYALTGHFRKRSLLDDLAVINKLSLSEDEIAKNRYEKSKTVLLGDEEINNRSPLIVSLPEVDEKVDYFSNSSESSSESNK